MLNIIVTQEDIDAGERFKETLCPIALAAKRLGKGLAYVSGAENAPWTGACVDFGDGSFYLLPESAARFIADFDGGRLVSPFAFELTV